MFAGAGILVAIIGLASQKAFTNIFSGLFILIFKPFRIEDIIEFGNVQRGFLGVQISAVTEEQAKEADLPAVSGVYINNVTAGGAAESAGLEAGDIILKFDGKMY